MLILLTYALFENALTWWHISVAGEKPTKVTVPCHVCFKRSCVV